ncbi:MAG: OsmC family peroxiredoxin [Vicinamibacterales bacterium]
MARHAEAEWKGDLKGGSGHVKLGSGAFEGSYSFHTRFEDGIGANPEEMLGAAQAKCYSMALANSLAQAGFPALSVHTRADVHLGKDDKGFLVTGIDLTVNAVAPGLDSATFQEHVEKTRVGCIISRALASTPIRVTAELK